MDDRLERLQKIVQDLETDDYNKGRRDALDEVMSYSYGMLTAEKYGLRRFIESKRRGTYRDAVNIAIEALSVDLVRCGGCKWQDKGENECEAWNLCALRGYTPTSDNHFCSYGERRSDD